MLLVEVEFVLGADLITEPGFCDWLSGLLLWSFSIFKYNLVGLQYCEH